MSYLAAVCIICVLTFAGLIIHAEHEYKEQHKKLFVEKYRKNKGGRSDV